LKSKSEDAADAKDAKILTQFARDDAASVRSSRPAIARQIVERAQELGFGLHVKEGQLLRNNVWADDSFISEIREYKTEIIDALQHGWGA